MCGGFLYCFSCKGLNNDFYEIISDTEKSIKWYALDLQRSKNIEINKRDQHDMNWHRLDSLTKEDLFTQISSNKKGLIFTFSRNLIQNSTHGTPEVNENDNHRNDTLYSFYRKFFTYLTRIQNILNSSLVVLSR